MNVAIYQPEAMPMAIVSFTPGIDAMQAAKQAVPAGVPFWIVPKSEIDALYADHGAYRDAWEASETSIGRKPDGVGEA
ncbi:hypothetical protein [Stutzerimonas nitrititolerans]|uniref:Uncharacterized protein n=1 Tax=Stutzerimonas nitrititolerans TaxID=2482751 RepID=A0AA42BEV4_9GAMM|nr:hypothetical protein [Stutzerimonas nitrititolerans]MCO7546190.1 hypothetical protein [Stutzerimonas nitrititolerans]